jgi:hypothetical protein
MVIGGSDFHSKRPGNQYHRSNYINNIKKVNKKQINDKAPKFKACNNNIINNQALKTLYIIIIIIIYTRIRNNIKMNGYH